MTRPRILAAALATSLALAAAPAVAEDEMNPIVETAGEVTAHTVDLFVLRPLGLCRLAFGAFVAMPISSTLNLLGLPIGQEPKVFSEDWDRYVVEPAEYTFQRRVGEDLSGF